MNSQFSTIPITEDHLKLYMVPKIIVVRLFYSPHLWYAGILLDHGLKNDLVTIQLESSIRFERHSQKEFWLPSESLIKATSDRSILDTKDKVFRFTLTEAQTIVHPLFREENGIIGIQHMEGFTHLSFRSADVVSVKQLLETN